MTTYCTELTRCFQEN